MTLKYEKAEPFIFPIGQESDKITDSYALDTQKNYSGLSRKQIEACAEYNRNQGDSGTRNDAPHKFINKYIRDLTDGSITQIDKKHQNTATVIYNALESCAHKIRLNPLYRGSENVPIILSSASIGGIIRLNQFISMSSHPIAATTFCEPNGAMMIIKNAKGISTHNNRECEYIGHPGSQFRVDRVYLQDWIWEDLIHTNLLVCEVEMLDTYIPIKHIKKRIFPWS